MPISTVTNEDCMIMMSRYPDKFFELAIVDPPYGLNIVKNGTLNISAKTKHIYKKHNWDEETPKDAYFKELFRVSVNQIIWGGNYFPYLWQNGCKGFVHWDKLNHHDNRSDGELAWTSFNRPSMNFKYMWDGNRYGFEGKINGVGRPSIRIHPTQKPTQLYQWLLTNYAKPGDKILDTHLGSGSSRIAAFHLGFDFYGCELDEDYFKASEKRFKEQTAQQQLFNQVGHSSYPDSYEH